MINYAILLATSITSLILGVLLVKFTIDELRGKEWALKKIIGLFALISGILVFAMNFNASIELFFGLTLGFVMMHIINKFSSIGAMDYSAIMGFLLTYAYFNGAYGLIIITSLIISLIPSGTLIKLSIKNKSLKKILISVILLASFSLSTYPLFMFIKSSLLNGFFGGMFIFYGSKFIVKGESKAKKQGRKR